MDYNFEGKSWDDLKQEIERLNNVALWTDKVLRDTQTKLRSAGEIVGSLIELGNISDEYDIEQLVELLDLDIEKEVDVEITVRITGSVKVPYNYSSRDVDVYIGDVQVADNSVNGMDYDVESIDFSE